MTIKSDEQITAGFDDLVHTYPDFHPVKTGALEARSLMLLSKALLEQMWISDLDACAKTEGWKVPTECIVDTAKLMASRIDAHATKAAQRKLAKVKG